MVHSRETSTGGKYCEHRATFLERLAERTKKIKIISFEKDVYPEDPTSPGQHDPSARTGELDVRYSVQGEYWTMSYDKLLLYPGSSKLLYWHDGKQERDVSNKTAANVIVDKHTEIWEECTTDVSKLNVDAKKNAALLVKTGKALDDRDYPVPAPKSGVLHIIHGNGDGGQCDSRWNKIKQKVEADYPKPVVVLFTNGQAMQDAMIHTAAYDGARKKAEEKGRPEEVAELDNEYWVAPWAKQK